MLFSDFIFLILEQDGTGHESFFQDYDGTGIFSFFNFVMGLGQDKIIFVGAGWERSEYPHLCHLLDHNRKWHSENNLFAN